MLVCMYSVHVYVSPIIVQYLYYFSSCEKVTEFPVISVNCQCVDIQVEETGGIFQPIGSYLALF